MKALLLNFILCCFLLASCAQKQELTFTTNAVNLLASGPLMEGSNTAQGEFRPELDQWLKSQGLSLSDVTNAKLVKASLILPDSLNSSLISEITLHLAAEKVDMQKVGVLNPVPEGQTQLSLQVAQDQQGVAAFLRQPSMTFVADVNVKKDTMPDLPMKGIFEFQLTVKR
ncbi:MAG TPA: hypothetical protein VK168_04545 [Saprospiraceae bacterium]|nr:hypothetical protein [Saprospiraceae bacterium]